MIIAGVYEFQGLSLIRHKRNYSVKSSSVEWVNLLRKPPTLVQRDSSTFSSISACSIQRLISSLNMKLSSTSLVRCRNPVNVTEADRKPGTSDSSRVRKDTMLDSASWNHLWNTDFFFDFDDFSQAASDVFNLSSSSPATVTDFSTNRFSNHKQSISSC